MSRGSTSPLRLATALIGVATALSMADSAAAGQVHFVTGGLSPSVFIVEDRNGDGAALDIGEVRLWATNIGSPQGIATRGSVVWVVDAALAEGRVWRCEDLNFDGDALDVGEATLWASGLSEPRDIVLEDDGAVLVSNLDPGQVWRLRDVNLDGDALDVGEAQLFAASPFQLAGLMLRPDGVYVSSAEMDAVFRCRDNNGDGDALDAGEFQIHALHAGALGLFDLNGSAYLVSGTSDVVHAEDINADDDALDAGESLPFATDAPFSLAGAAMMAALDSRDRLLAAEFADTVYRIGDQNDDGDALDIGEVRRYCTIDRPYGIAARDIDGDGVIDGMDNCPETFNPSQSDTNANGVGDACETCPADINADGVVNIVDLLALLAAWGPNPGHAADIDYDDTVGVVDLLALLAAWGPCP